MGGLYTSAHDQKRDGHAFRRGIRTMEPETSLTQILPMVRCYEGQEAVPS